LTDFSFAIVIPVYNHGATLRLVVEKALKFATNVIVVDDGSIDPVDTSLSGLDVRLLRHKTNKGKGAAILTGAAEAGKMGMTHIITLDADGQHDPNEISIFISAIRENPSAIIIGKRRFDEAAPTLSRFGRAFSNFWFHLQTGHAIGDIQSGFRAYPLPVLQRLKLRERHYSFEIEAPVKASWAGVPVRDVDISVYYPPRDKRVSHFRLFRDNLRLTILNTRLTTRAMVGLPHAKIDDDPAQGSGISILHPLRLLKVLIRGEHLRPSTLGLSAALGVFLGALPVVGCKPIAILGSASYLRLNQPLAFAAAQVCFPPFVPALCVEAGYYMRHGRFLTEISLKTIGYQAFQRYLEWVMGFFVVAPLLAILVGLVIYLLSFSLKRGMKWRTIPSVKNGKAN
jgi:glycosyltransferase involved in cell wall biosynthesis